MTKKLLFLLFLLINIFLFCSCGFLQTNKPKITEANLKESSFKILELLQLQDFQKLDSYIDKNKAILFYPYQFIDTANCQKLTLTQLMLFEKENKKLKWGIADGTGDEIFLTVTEYFEKYVNDKNYLLADSIKLNSVVAGGNLLSNIAQVFPNCSFVHYYCEGDEQYGYMNWGSLNLVFLNLNNNFELIGIIHNKWTI